MFKKLYKNFEKSKAGEFLLNSKLARSVKNNKYCYYSGIAAALIMIFVYIVYKLIPFGDAIILRMDLYHQYGPLFAEFYDRIANFQSLIYSWTSGLGSSFLGNFLNYISSPFAIVMLLFGHERMPEAIATMILLMASFSAGTFTYYIKKSFGKHDIVTAAFGLLYAFCGYFVAFYWNVMWLDAMIIFPIVILGIEKIINGKKMATYLFALFYSMLTGYYMAFMICIMSVVYFLIYYFSKFTLSEKVNPLLGKPHKQYSFKVIVKRLQNSKFINYGVKFAFASLAAAGLIMILYLPLYYILQSSSATGASWPEKYSSYFSVFDFLANHLAGVEPTIRSSGEDVLPNVYCGMITVLLIPFYFYSKKISIREKITSLLLLAFFYFSFNINYFNFVWHGFKFPNDLPYRFSFMYSFILIVLAYKAFMNIKEFSMGQILTAGVAVIGFVVLVQEIGSKNVGEPAVWASIAFIVVYVLIFAFMRDEKYQKAAMASLLMCAICTELIVADTPNYVISQTKTAYAKDYEDFVEMKSLIDENEDSNDFYRMEVTKQRARMDPSWYNYNGVSVFSSMAYESVSKLQKKLGLYGNDINSHSYKPQTPVYNSMFALKYLYDNASLLSDDQPAYSFVDSSEYFNVYSNNYYLPLGFAVDTGLADWTFGDDLNPFREQNNFFSLATGVDDVFSLLPMEVYELSNCKSLGSYSTASPSISYVKQTEKDSGSFVLIIKLEESQNIYLYASSSTIKTINIGRPNANWSENYPSADQFTFDKTSYSLESPYFYIFDAGYYEAGETIALKVNLPEDNTSGSLTIRASGIDMDEFERGYNQILSNGTLDIDTFKETYIKGTINVASDMLLYTSIPYDEGWSVTIDGERVPVSEYEKIGDALLAVPISEGEHTVEFKFTPRGMLLGGVVSVSTVGLLILVYFLNKRKFFMFDPAYADKMFAKKKEEE